MTYMQFSKLYKVKEGKIDILKQWFTILSNERKKEAIDTFAHEHITREIFIMFNGNDGHSYVLGCNETDGNMKKGDQTVPINQDHAKVKRECLESISEPGKIVLDLDIKNN